VKILIDMNLTPLWREPLEAAGHEAKHWSEVGEPSAADEILMEWSRANGFVVFTHDLDYGILLYTTEAAGPSVIQLRSDNVSPEFMADIVTKSVREAAWEIERGALVTVHVNRHRIAMLPLKDNKRRND
jgi:predicted nuclease of predicted toxin-antitoxin system